MVRNTITGNKTQRLVKTVVGIRPGIDESSSGPLRFTHYWLGMMLDEARKSGFNVIDISDEMATESVVVPTLRRAVKTGPVFVIGSGHGQDDTLTGQRLAPVINTSLDIDLRGSVAYFMSCRTAQELGSYLVKRCGASSFLGYTRDYLLLRDDVRDPEFDGDMQPFMQLFSVPGLTLIWGGSTSDALNNAIKVYNAWSERYSNMPSKRELMSLLQHNLQSLVSYGEDVYITPEYRTLDITPLLPAQGLNKSS